MMNELSFDLQRFNIDTVLSDNATLAVTIAGTPKTIKAGTDNSVSVSVIGDESDASAAVVSISNPTHDFFIDSSINNSINSFRYEVTEGNGIVISLGGGSAASVGSIDNGDIFIVNNEKKFSKTADGFFSGDANSSVYDKIILGSSPLPSTLALTGSSIPSEDLESNWYKIISVTNGNLILDSADDFDSSGYKGVIAADTGNPIEFYAQLSKRELPDRGYRISSISSASELSTITFTANVLSGGVVLSGDFIGSTGVLAPTVVANGATFHVDKSNGYILLAAGKDSAGNGLPVSLNSNAKGISLISGSLRAVDAAQTISTSQYTLSAQDGDGIIIYSDKNGNATLDDIDIGESFYLYDKTSSTGMTYTMTKIGLVNADGDLLIESGTTKIKRLKDSKLVASVIGNADIHTAIDPTEAVISLTGGNTFTSLIAYGNDACATLSGKNNSYSLTTDYSAYDLNLGSWQGISLKSAATLSVDEKFISSGTSPLEFQVCGNTFGLVSINSSLDAYSLSGSMETLNFNRTLVGGLTLTKGELVLNMNQNATLTGSDNFELKNLSNGTNRTATLTSDGNGTTTIVTASNIQTSLNAERGNFYGYGTLTVDSGGNVSTYLESNGDGVSKLNSIAVDSTTYTVAADKSKGVSLKLIYGKNSGTSITGFDAKDTITVLGGNGNSTVYSMSGKKLKAISGDNFQVWMQDDGYSDVNSNTVIDLENSDFRDFILGSGASLSIDGSYGIGAMENEEERIIIGGTNKNDADPEKSYGSLTKKSDSYKLTKGLTDKESLTNIFITDSLSVEFDENFSNTDINVKYYGTSTKAITKANFLSRGGESFTVTPATDISPVHISGATAISLGSGTLHTDESTQTISAASYSISSFKNNDTDDGITVEISLGSNSSQTAIIRDIDKSESFYVNNVKYTRDAIGLTTEDNRVYYGGYLDSLTESYEGALGINVANLGKMSRLIAAESVDGIGNVLEIGTRNSVDAVVADKYPESSKRQANLVVTGDTYSLVSIEGAADLSWSTLDMISLTGGVTSINASLVAGKTIVAAGSDAEFQVTKAKSNNTFSVRGNSKTPSINGADKINLFNGTIAAIATATQAQTIAISDINRNFVPNSSDDGNIIIAYDKVDSIATITGEKSDAFTLSGAAYSVKSGNGMNVVVDSSDVTLAGLYANEGDVFIYDGETYSLRAVGLVRKEGSKSTVASLWNYNNSHSIAGGSVAVSDLTKDDYWNTIEVIKDYIATIPSSEAASLDNITFVDSENAEGGFLKTYGSIQRKNGVYSLTKTPDEGLIDGVNIQSGVRAVNVSSVFSAVSITAPNASVKVAGLSEGAEDYSVTIYSGVNNNGIMGLTNVTNASLIGGSLQANKDIEVVANSRKIHATESSNIIVSSSDNKVSIGGLDLNESFTIDDENSYTLSAIGLTNDKSQLLEKFTLKSGGSNEVIALSTIRDVNNWRDYIAPEDNVLTIKNNDSRIPDEGVLVVDNKLNPTARLAKVDKIDTNTFSVSLDVEPSWPSADIIKIDNAGVSLTSDFQNKTIEGANSGATFTVTNVTNNKNFFVKDTEYYTSITGAKEVNLTAGTIETNDKDQTIAAGGKQISFSNQNKGDGIRVAVGSTSTGSISASIAALNLNDVFTVGGKAYSMVSDKKLKTGDETSGYELWVGTISNSVVPVSALEEEENWLSIIEATNGALTLSSASVLSSDQAALVIDTDVNKVYGTLTKTTAGYNLTQNDASENTFLSKINLDDNYNKLNLTSDFKGVSISAGGTTFRAKTVDSIDNSFSVYYSGEDVSVEKASALTLDKGTVKTSLSNQTITADGYDIHRFDSDSTITVIKNGNVVVGELEDGETFGIGKDTYTFFDNGVGVIRTKENSTIKSIADTGWDDSGRYTVGSTFDKDVIAVSNKELNLSNQKNNAVVVDDLTSPTKRLADLSSSNNSFSITSDFAESITSILFGGNKDVSLSSGFNTTVKTDEGNHTFTINGDAYRAAGVALTIKSGTSDNNEESRLINGAVALVATLPSNSVSTETKNTITANAGDGITVTAAGNSPVTITALNKGDRFSVDDTAYSVTGAGLFTDNKIWTPATYDEIVINSSASNGLTNKANWDDIVAVKNGVLEIPPLGYANNVTTWTVLSEDREHNYGKLSSIASGYSIEASEYPWGNDTISINGQSVAFSAGFTNKNIAGVESNAVFKVTDNNIPFNVIDGRDGATITGDNVTKISQSDGTIVLTNSSQSITTADNHTVSFVEDSSGNGINVIVGGGSASIGALSIENNQDSFIVDGVTYKMVSNGSIQRKDNKTFWTHSKLEDKSALSINDLQNDDYWGGYITITDGILKIDENTLGKFNSAFVIDKEDETDTETNMHIYGTLAKVKIDDTTFDESTYSLDHVTKITALSGIEVTTGVPNVSLTSGYIEVPITAGNTQFQVTNTKSSNGSYVVHYNNDGLSVDNVTALSLLKGNWTLNDDKQTLKADGQTIQISSSGEVSISYSGSTSDGVNITGLDTAGEVITLNSDKYTFNAGDGISVSIKGTNATVNAISDNDSFTIAEDTFVKKSAGFLKANKNSYLWTGTSDVTKGVAVSDLRENDNNWTAVATVANDNIIINSKSNDAVFIDSIDNLSKIYGELSIADNVYGLSDKIDYAETSLITVEDVVAGISSAFVKIPIKAAGASFAVVSLTSGNQFTVDATENNAILGNVSDVSLTSGTLADLTSATTVKTSIATIAAQDNSTVNVGFDGSEITIGELEHGESFTLNRNTYAYRNVGVVKNGNTLYVNESLDGSLTNTSLAGADFQTMFKSDDGITLTLQNRATGVFVDSADNNVSKVYVSQTYADKNYTFSPITDSDYIIDAASLASGGSISAAFEAQVITPETGTFTINKETYKAVSALTVDTTKDSSTLNKGTVSLSEGDFVDMTNVKDNISVTGGNGIHVTANDGSYTLGELNKNDTFTIGGYSYLMKSNVFIVRTGSDGTEEVYSASVMGGALEQRIIDEPDYWNVYVHLDSNSDLNLDSSVKGGTVISSDFSEMYANLEVNKNTFTIAKIEGADTSGIRAVNLAAEDSTLTTDFAATVKTTSGTNTFTVNNNPYTAKDSALEIQTTDKSSSITRGIITLKNSTVATTSNHTITGSVDELDVAAMKFTPAVGEKFTLDSVNYEMTELGLTKGDTSIWTRSSDEYYVLPSEDTWSNMMRLSESGTLNLQNGASDGSTVILDNGATKRMALMTYGDNAYELTSVDGNVVNTIQLGDSTGTLKLTADFNSDVTTGNGTYEINGSTYKGDSLTIKTKSDDNSSSLYNGVVNLYANDSVTDTNGNSVKVTADDEGVGVEAVNGTITTLSNLTKGDTFTINNKRYKVLGGETLVQINADGNPSKLYEDLITGSSLKYSDIIDDDKFVTFIRLEEGGVLNLSTRYGDSGWTAIVLADDSNGEPTERIAKVSYTDEDGYKLETTSTGDLSKLSSIKLGSAVKTFSTDLDAIVNTTATGTPYTINGKNFTAQNDLTIAVANSTNAVLINGSVTLNEDSSVTTRRTNNNIQTEENIKATSGTVTVTVDNAESTVTIAGLNTGEKFDVDGTEYTMTRVGLLNGNLINSDVATTASVRTDDLSGENWKTILPITDGELNLTAETVSNVLVVDLTKEAKYGILTKSGDTYTLTQDDTDSALSKITMSGTKAIFGTKSQDVDITANGATFTAKTGNTFTVNAAPADISPIISDATAVYLNDGTIQAPANVPVIANGNEVSATSGNMTVTNTSGTVTVEGLDSGETFTANGANYKVTTSGKLFDMTDAANPSEVMSGFANKVFTLNNPTPTFMRIIAIDGNNLNLKNQTSDALVYDSLIDPILKLATLTVGEGRAETLTGENGAESEIQTVEIDVNDNLTVLFETKVKSPIGSVTVNTKTYTGATELVLDSKGTDGTNATLYEGTVTLNQINPSATDSRSNTVERENGSFNATADNGKFISINNLDNEESFTYGGKTYSQSAQGLIDTTNKVICTAISTGSTVTLADLNSTSTTWDYFCAPVDGVLDISTLSNKTLIFDEEINPTKHLATLNVDEDIKKILNDNESQAAPEINTIKIGANDKLTVDFVTKINTDSSSDSFSVNDKTYKAYSSPLVIDSVIDSENKTSALYSGTITLDYTNPSATDSRNNTLTRNGGSFNATAESGKFTTLTDLDPTESFTYNGVTYTQSERGLMNGSQIRSDLAGTTLDLSKLGGSWENIIAPVNGVLDISNVNNDSRVYDSATNPTTQLATLTIGEGGKKILADYQKNSSALGAVSVAANDNLAVNFVTKVKSPVGSVTVNGKSYVGTTELVIDSSKKSSTLGEGTVSLTNKDDNVTTTSGSTITYTNEGGDGLTVTSTAEGAVTIGGLTLGDTFKVGDTSYNVSPVGPIDDSNGKLWNGNDYRNGITVDALNVAANWDTMLQMRRDTLIVNPDTAISDGEEFILVDNINNPSKVYGALGKADGKYNLAKAYAAKDEDKIASLDVSGVTLEISSDYAGIDIVANTSNYFSNVALNEDTESFTLDTSGTTPSLSAGVKSLTLGSGSIVAAVNQTVTAGDKVITPTAINGTMIISDATINGIVKDDSFKLGDKVYKMLDIGLFNDTDSKFVTEGITTEGTLTFDNMIETPLIAVNSAGVLDLTKAVAGDYLVVDNVKNPTEIYGKLNKAENIYKLDKQGETNGINFIAMPPDADATLTTDVSAEIDTPAGSNTFTVNKKEYKADNSTLAIESDGSTSTLSEGKISFTKKNDTVTTTNGNEITYMTNGDGMTVQVEEDGTITFGGLTLGDTFTVGNNSYKVSAIGPINSDNELWKGNDYNEGITLDAINTPTNWTSMLAAPGKVLSIDSDTMADGVELIVVDSINAPTEIYGNLTKADDKYILTKPANAVEDLTSFSIDISKIAIEIAPEYAGATFGANGSNFSNVVLNNAFKSFTMDASGNTPILSDNVKSLTLDNGTIVASTEQAVTTGGKTIKPTAINGTMIISSDNVNGITEGDAFTFNGKNYKMIGIGLFNDNDNKLVTYGMEGGTWTYNSFEETQLIAVSPAGTLTLANAGSGDSLVVNNVENPTAIYGRLNKNGNIYKLDKQGKEDGIKSVTMPKVDSTLTTDIAAIINTPVTSKTFTVNRKEYKAKNSALVINSDGATSTLTEGTVSLTDRDDSVATTGGSIVTYTKDDGDGMTLQVRANGSVILEGLTEGDTFKVGENSYKVTPLGFHNNNLDLWTGSADYKRGVTISDTADDGINNPNNWTKTVTAEDKNFVVKAETLENGESVIVIDSAEYSTKQLGTLSKADDIYTLINDSDEMPVTIAVINTKLTIDSKLAAVPVTANGATFTVKVNENYTVDATGTNVSISEEATAIEISKGTINATSVQTVTATNDSGDTKVVAQGNGTFNIGNEEFLIAGNVNDINFHMTNGVPNAVSGFEKGATATIDGTIYTSPKDDSTLKFSDTDGWYFDGYIPENNKYNITVDGDGNVTVDIGVRFSDVVASGRTLTEDGKIKLAADVNNFEVNVTNNGSTRIGVIDKDNNSLVENLGKVSDVLFNAKGATVEKTSDVAGAMFTLNVGRNFETETATVSSNATGCEVGVGTDGTSLSVDKSATVDAPANTELTLGNADYKVNGVDFSTGGTAQASITSDGVKVDLVISDPITYYETKFDGTESATADFDKDGGITLTSGASVSGAAGKALNIAGNIILDSNTIDAATSTDVTAKADGLKVGDDDLTVIGDDGYKVDIVEGKITGLENIGAANGVTVGGLSNGTIKTDKIGSFTVAERTFTAIGDASITYGIEDGKITYVNDVDSILSGDFSDGLKVNGGNIQVTGEKVSLRADTEADREIIGIKNDATLTTAEGVTKVEPIGAGKFTFGDHVFETSDPTVVFNLLNSSVTGIDSLQSGNLIISQDENNLGINKANVTLSEVDSPVTLGIANSNINSIYGLNGGIKGIDNATVYGLAEATVNDKFFDIDGDEVNAIISDGAVTNILGLDKGASVNSAPSVDLRTTGNGNFTFKDDTYNINDTLDGVVVFTTDINSNIKNIGEFEGSIYGDLDDINLNDKLFRSSSDKVTVANDGENITEISGLASGDSIGGSLSLATYLMPEGTLTVNDRTYILRGDDNGVSISGDGMFVLGLDLDSSLTVAKGGSYSVNNESFNAKDGDTFIAGRDHVYIYDPNNKPITEKTSRDDIIRTLIGEPDPSTVSLSGDSAAEAIASGKLDSPMAMTLDNSSGSSVQNADFSNSRYTKRVTLLGGDQDVKFNDEGKNAAYIDSTANGKKNIELGDGGDVAVNDSPYAKVSIKTGKGADTIVNRHDGTATVDVQNNSDTTIVPTSGKVTLQNYDSNNHAKIRSFEYTDLVGAIKNNSIKFGDGVMTLGDAIVNFNPDADEKGSTFANLVDYMGEQKRVGFTHTDGGVINAKTSSDDLILKGNYAESSSDTTKTGASTLIGGNGDDTILAGEGDYINGGAGDNQIYITDKSLRGTDGATIVLGNKGRNTIHNFNNDYDVGDEILVNDIGSLKFNYETEDGEGLVMRSGGAQITFDGLTPAEYLVSFDDSETDTPYEMRIKDGKNQYNVAIAQEGRNIGVDEFSEANVFFGNKEDGSGLDFSEYSGSVEVNLNLNAGRLNGEDAKIFNINKLHAGDGNSTLIGKAGDNNTLIAGTGYTSMWSAAGKDLMVGDTSDEKDGSTMFYYMAKDGRDTISGFGYIAGENDYNADIISLPGGNIVTEVFMQGEDIIMQINASNNDYLMLQEAVGKDFELNDRIAKVDTQGNFDNLADFYVVAEKNATMKVGADVGNAQVWLDDGITGEHGIIYKGEIKYLDASTANGNNTLVGNDLDNVIYGGEGANSIWGGYGASRDTLVGGKGHNIFFFGLENGTDIVTSINSGDVVYLANGLEQIAATTITSGGTKIELVDGSSIEIQGNAKDVEYMLNDGSKYTADHSTGQWNKK